MAVGHQARAACEHRQRTQAHQGLDDCVLDGLPAQEGALQLAEPAASLRNFSRADGATVEGRHGAQALDAVDGMRGNLAGGFP